MRCIYCDTDNNYKTRVSAGLACGKCGKRFAFEPKNGVTDTRVTDRLFLHAIEEARGKGRGIVFTEDQLRYTLDRRLSAPRGVGSWIALAVFVGIASLCFGACALGTPYAGVSVFGVPLLLFALFFGLSLVRSLARRAALRSGRSSRPPEIAERGFHGYYIEPWDRAHGKIDGLAPRIDDPESLPDATPWSRPLDRDVTAYSFDRAVVCDRDDTAAMLVANNFHFENNCAVLSIGGYPHGAADTILAMLRRNLELQVFAVHDASVEGCSLPLKLRKEAWFPDSSMAMVDLGLRPRQTFPMMLPTRQGHQTVVPSELRGYLSDREVTWLEAGNLVALAALPPARLLRGIYQGMARANRDRKGVAPVSAEPERGSRWAPLAAAAALLAFLPWFHGSSTWAAEEEQEAARRAGSSNGITIELGGWEYDSGADVFAADSFG